ncbi:MAG: hypothetical protein VXY93_01875 [Pseudomonadota bacterium]|nr:hypothetical protein [Pseudomonadota bacterium]
MADATTDKMDKDITTVFDHRMARTIGGPDPTLLKKWSERRDSKLCSSSRA